MATPRQRDDDDSLLKRIILGESEAITSLYDRYASEAYSIAHRILRDTVLAEGIVSDLFLSLWRDPRPFLQIRGSLSPALATMARDRAVALLSLYPSVDGSAATHDDSAAAKPPAPLTLPEVAAPLAGTGLDVVDLQTDAAFGRRRLHLRDLASHLEGVNRLVQVFAGNTETILQQLVNIAVDLCGADSAGISIEQPDSPDEQFYLWVATAGQYSGFMDAKLPRYPSACGVTLERGRPQIFRVSQKFFDRMGVHAPTVTDGILLPWKAGKTRGTIWIMAHGRDEAFDREDCTMMQVLADFAATGVNLQQQQQLLLDQARTESAAAMANHLAHQINNPLQGLMQSVFLFGQGGPESAFFAEQAMGNVVKLSELARNLLSVR